MKILRRHASRRGYFTVMACLRKLGQPCPGIFRGIGHVLSHTTNNGNLGAHLQACLFSGARPAGKMPALPGYFRRSSSCRSCDTGKMMKILGRPASCVLLSATLAGCYRRPSTLEACLPGDFRGSGLDTGRCFEAKPVACAWSEKLATATRSSFPNEP